MPVSTPEEQAALEAVLDYRFKDAAHLTLALTHRSYDGERNNERLEFLGDAILSFVIGNALFQRFPEAREGQLSRLRAKLVKGDTLAKIGRQLELGPYLRLGPGELKSGGARRDSILADAIEALIGAVFQDGGLPAAEQLIQLWFKNRLATLTLDDPVKDNKTRLQELLQSRGLELPNYRIVDASGAAHAQFFKVACEIQACEIETVGEGTSRRRAEQQAAGAAVQKLMQLGETPS